MVIDIIEIILIGLLLVGWIKIVFYLEGGRGNKGLTFRGKR